MRKLIIGLMLATAVGCRSGTSMASAGQTGSLTGAASAKTAVDLFLAAVNATDLQAMGAIWGTPDGAARDHMDMTQLQQRELTMMCYLAHDSYNVLSEAPALHNTRTYAVQMKFQNITHVGQFNVGKASDGRYYVFSIVNFSEFQDVCARKRGN